MTFIYDTLGRKVNLDHVRMVDHLVKLKQENGSNPWPVIEACFNFWASLKPTKYRSYLIYLKDIKETRKDRKFGSTKDKVTGGILRYTLDIPEEVIFMIRCIYNADELPMDRKFFMEFARRFPRFKVADKL